METIKAVAQKLGNTPAVCRRSYIHPAILRAYEDGTLLEAWKKTPPRKHFPTRGLHQAEISLLQILETLAIGTSRRLKAG